MLLSVAFSVLSVILPIVFAQDSSSGSGSDSFGQGLISYLNNLGYTEAASLITRANSSSTGQQLLSQLPNRNYTVFVPNNAAFQNLPDGVSGDDQFMLQYFLYHVVQGDFSISNTSSPGGGGAGGAGEGGSASSSVATPSSAQSASAVGASSRALAWYIRQSDGSGSSDGGSGASARLRSLVYPNVTIGRTLLDSSNLVRLEGNKSQVISWTRYSETGNVTILNQSRNITVINSAVYQNLFLNTIDGVLIPPRNLSTALNATNVTSFVSIAQSITEQSPNGTNITAINALSEIRGFTLFVPNNQAFQQAQQITQQFQDNQTALAAILNNHVINGTTIYSPDLWNATSSGSGESLVTAAGTTLSFSSNSSGLFLQNQNGSSAQIVRSDVLLANGVFHIIDNLLIDTDSNLAQASSAVASALSAATASSFTDSLPIGGGFATATPSPLSSLLSGASLPSMTLSLPALSAFTPPPTAFARPT